MVGLDVLAPLITVSCKGSWGGMLGVADFSTLYLHKAPRLLLACWGALNLCMSITQLNQKGN